MIRSVCCFFFVPCLQSLLYWFCVAQHTENQLHYVTITDDICSWWMISDLVHVCDIPQQTQFECRLYCMHTMFCIQRFCSVTATILLQNQCKIYCRLCSDTESLAYFYFQVNRIGVIFVVRFEPSCATCMPVYLLN